MISTVLLADDDPSCVMLLRRAFRKAAIPVALQVVPDGDTAVSYLGGQGVFADRLKYPAPAVLLLDLKLPRRSGLEVLQWLRSQDTLRRIPVVVLTSSQEPGDVNRAYEYGANSYLVKPIDAGALLDLVCQLHHYWLELNQMPTLFEMT
jgi:CheY-like chemotaxis protein